MLVKSVRSQAKLKCVPVDFQCAVVSKTSDSTLDGMLVHRNLRAPHPTARLFPKRRRYTFIDLREQFSKVF